MNSMPLREGSSLSLRRDAGVAIVVRSDDPARTAARLQPIRDALAEASVPSRLVTYDDDHPEALGDDLLDVDGALVWADPLTDRGSRSALDAELVRLGRPGLWVSAEPEVVALFGTKDVLVTTRALSWGSDTVAYPTMREFRERFPGRLAEHGSLVVKADRGNGGRTVWNVTLLSGQLADVRKRHHADPSVRVMVQHARLRDDTHVRTTLRAFMESRSSIYSESGGRGHL